MKRKGNEYLKNEKDRETADNEGRNGKLSAVFGMKKKKIVDENKNSDNSCREDNAGTPLSKGKAEIFEGFSENKHDGGSRKDRKKKKREPKCFSISGLRKNKADSKNKRGAKTNQEIPPGELSAVFSFDEFHGHKICSKAKP